jgi:glycosyltransferase involved in cell wall biosynthesis
MKRITIDASSILPGRKMDGVGRTTLGLIKQFSKMDDLPFEIRLFTQRLRGQRLKGYPFKNCHLPLPRWEIVSSLTRKFPIIESMCKSDLYHIPHNYAPLNQLHKTVVTLHDAMFLTHPEPHLGHKKLAEIIPAFAKKCKAIITCSEYSKHDIVNYMDIEPDKVHVIYWGIDHEHFYYKKNIKNEREYLEKKFNLKRPYFLSVSCGIGRKNTPKLINDFLKFVSQDTKNDLVLVWRSPSKEIIDRIKNHPYGNKIHILSNINDSELVYLYRGATALFFPSLYEGFGLPVLEAMACGIPVVTTKSSSLPEVGGDAAIYVDPYSDEMINVMQAFEEGKINRQEIIEKGLKHVKKFTWERCAEETIKVYKKLLEK